MLTDTTQGSERVASVGGLFVGSVSLALAFADFFRQVPLRPSPAAQADDLALTVTEQWLEEARGRRLRDPRVLPLAWAATSRNVSDRIDSGAVGAAARLLRMRLNGRLDGRFEEVTGQLADGYERLPNRRLVVLGEPGAGKTVLAILLTLGLLATREVGGPVPVLIEASSWDPVRESLDDWIVRTLAVPYYNGREEIPRALLEHGLLLPVLDGLDEIPESARRSAVRGINRAIGMERPVVVTCRAAEYEDLVRGGAPVLRQAPVVEVSPVPPGDVIAYLRDLDWPEGIDWGPVFGHLRSEPDGAVASALSTPLMISSARLVYQRSGADPAELLDSDKFDCRIAVEDHLTRQLVDAAYAPDPLLAGQPADRSLDGLGRWDAEQARRWLTFLARYLHDHRERDLAWWLMSQRLLSPWIAPATGIGIGLVLMVFSAAWASYLGPSDVVLVVSECVGGGFAVLATIVWSVTPGRAPGRLSLAIRGSWGRLRRGFRAGIALTTVSVVPVLIGFAVTVSLSADGGPWSFGAVERYCKMLMICVAMAAVVGLALAAHNWLDAPPVRSAQIGPLQSVAQDRLSSVVGALIAGAVVGATGLLGWIGGDLAGSLVYRVLTGWPGWPASHDVGALAASRWHTVLGAFGHDRYRLIVTLAVLLPATVFALLVLLTRAWPRFVLVRMILAVRGQLPWQLLAFLADARERELLRQSGGTYQFRHIRLQETLAGLQPATGAGTPASVGRPVARRTVLAAGAATSAAAVTAIAIHLPRDGSKAAFAVHGGGVLSVAFQPKGRLIAGGDDGGGVWLWDAYDHQALPVLLRMSATDIDVDRSVTALAFDRSGRNLAICTHQGTVEVWDVSTRTRSKDFPNAFRMEDRGVALAFHPQKDNVLAGCGKSTVHLWTPGTHRRTRAFDGTDADLAGLAFNPADGSLAVNNELGEVELLTVNPLGKIAHLDVREPPTDSDAAMSLPRGAGVIAFTNNGGVLASAYGWVELWNTNTRKRMPHPDRASATSAVAFGRTASTLLMGGFDGTIRLWDTDTRREFDQLTGHTGTINAMAVNSHGKLATASDDGTVRLWNVT